MKQTKRSENKPPSEQMPLNITQATLVASAILKRILYRMLNGTSSAKQDTQK